MIRLGLDFDNTLIRYDELFHKVAREKGLISDSVQPQKNKIRNYLRHKGIENEWTKLQGEVYGNRILEAVAWEGMLEKLSALQERGVELYLISHKTKVPYLGPTYDLHAAALSWLDQEGFFSRRGLNWQPEQVFFELTKEEKVQRVQKLSCTHYVDDLPEILEMLPPSVKGVYFCPEKDASKIDQPWLVFGHWDTFPDLFE